MIRDKGFRKTVEAYNVLEEQLGELWGISGLIAGYEMGHLGKAANEHEEGIEATQFRKVCDKVIKDTLLRSIGDR